MNRKTIAIWFLAAFTTAALAATFDYNPPPLGSSEVEKRNDLNLELDGINSTKADLASPTFTGTVAGITKSMVGLGNVDNTADTAKPVSTAQQTALDLKETVVNVALKAPIASPTFTGTVSGITKSMVGLGSVDNTADTGKPVSTAQQTALDLKANLASPALTGTPTAPNAAGGTSTTQLATTNFVTTAGNLKADLASPTFTGTPAAPTASAATSTTQIATTAFATTADNLKANLASPTFTGVPAAPTASPGTSTTQLATTAFVAAAVGHTYVTKTSNQTNTTTTFANDTALAFAVAASTKYKFQFRLIIDSPAAADFKLQLTGPASPTAIRFGAQYITDGGLTQASTATAFSSAISLTATSPGQYVQINGYLSNGVNAGTVTLQWAQNSASGTTTVFMGSDVEYLAF